MPNDEGLQLGFGYGDEDRSRVSLDEKIVSGDGSGFEVGDDWT